MTYSGDVLKNEEKAMMSLRALYRKYGYTQYKMNKFEEYDLYVRNKNFLASEQIITFNDTNGKLLALKPDVTLSIVKNAKDDASLCKYFYNENVYRLSHTGREFKERMQAGLECIGPIDLYAMAEVILLADRSLQLISGRYALDISHMGYLSGLFDGLGLAEEQAARMLRCISEKNVPEIEKLSQAFGLQEDDTRRLAAIAALYGSFEETIGLLKKLSINERTDEAVSELESVFTVIKSFGAGENIRLDFSIVNDMTYYNGIIFQGFVDGIPTGVLSGGRYDKLLERFGKKAGAIGFAVYLDLLERFDEAPRPFDVDVLLLYDETTDAQALARAVKVLTDDNMSVRAERGPADGIKYRQLYQMKDGGFDVLERLD
ncbi:ATP phosphoribosyltransferase regulatory subunit [Oscillospiraceae bacterium WX1]